MMPAHTTINCASQGCYAIITLHPDDEDRLRRTHETFYCPAGHSNYFAGKTKQEKRIEEAEKDAAMWKRNAQTWREHWEGLMRGASLLAGGVKTCPFGCGWSSRRNIRGLWGEGDQEAIGRFLDRVGHDLCEHMREEHNATPEKVRLLPERATTH